MTGQGDYSVPRGPLESAHLFMTKQLLNFVKYKGGRLAASQSIWDLTKLDV